MFSDGPIGFCPDRLLELELRVARRADELARTVHIDTPLNLHCWLLAETEVLGAACGNWPDAGIPRATQPHPAREPAR